MKYCIRKNHQKEKKKQTSKESVEARKERARGTREADESSVGFMSMAVETFDGRPWICNDSNDM